MILFIDDEKWIIGAYLDELDNKIPKNIKYTPKHYYFPKEALEFAKSNSNSIIAFVIDIGMDFGDDDLFPKYPGGIQLYKEIRNIVNLKKIPIIILTVYDKESFSSLISIDDDKQLRCINRNMNDKDELLMNYIDLLVKNGKF